MQDCFSVCRTDHVSPVTILFCSFTKRVGQRFYIIVCLSSLWNYSTFSSNHGTDCVWDTVQIFQCVVVVRIAVNHVKGTSSRRPSTSGSDHETQKCKNPAATGDKKLSSNHQNYQ
ncbi:hypothetical protein LXL04_022495 [Taraxacum kok-saghyz]